MILPTNPTARKLLEHARTLIRANNFRQACTIMNMAGNLVDDENQAKLIKDAAGQCLAHGNGIETPQAFHSI